MKNTKQNEFNPNPSLNPLEMLLGNWVMEISNASFLPYPSARIYGKSSFEWIEDGAYIVLRQGDRDAGSPIATWLISRDESKKEFAIFYYDDRNVSRIYQMSFDKGLWKIWRKAPGFSQRFKGIISEDGKTITASWEKSINGKEWEHDFDLIYSR
jgi:hypothetical protein